MNLQHPQSLPRPHFQTIGHRGAAGLAPENTLAGFKRAKEAGLNWIEFDTQPCLTGEWVVFHDETLERTSDGYGSLINTPYSALQSLDVGSWFNSQYQQEYIPLLSEVLDTLVSLGLHANIEIKRLTHPAYSQSLINFLQILDNHWPKLLRQPLISSFDLEILLALKRLNPHLLLGYLVEEYQANTLDIMRANHFFSLHCDYTNLLNPDSQMLSPNYLEIINSGFPLLLYTVNDPSIARLLLSHGAAAIFSDFPNLIANGSQNSSSR